MASSYNGWPASRSPSAIGIVHFEPIKGHDFPAGVKGGDVHWLFTWLVRQLDARVEPIEHYRPGDEWGYSYRASANSPSKLSCHASGTAIDYNATKHPNGRRGTFTAAQVAQIRKIQAECNGVIRWLGDAKRVPDEMHFEIKGTAAQVHAAVVKLKAIKPPAPKPPAPKPPEDDDVKHIVRGDKSIQWWITDGITKRHINDTAEAGGLVYVGIAKWDNTKKGAYVWPQTIVDDITTMPRGKTIT